MLDASKHYVIVSLLFIKASKFNLRSYKLVDSMTEMFWDICNKMMLHFLELWGS